MLLFTYNNIGDCMKKFFFSIFRIFFPIAIGSIVGIAIKDNIDYNTLIKPPFSPPSIAFPIAWSIIYLLMGISYYLYRKKYRNDSIEITVYYSQLFVNTLWSIIFFIWKFRFLAVLWIFLLDFLVIWLFILFYRKKKVAAYLNIPYILWILFATYLTTGIYFLN